MRGGDWRGGRRGDVRGAGAVAVAIAVCICVCVCVCMRVCMQRGGDGRGTGGEGHLATGIEAGDFACRIGELKVAAKTGRMRQLTAETGVLQRAEELCGLLSRDHRLHAALRPLEEGALREGIHLPEVDDRQCRFPGLRAERACVCTPGREREDSEPM
jgi:hypothetical protein